MAFLIIPALVLAMIAGISLLLIGSWIFIAVLSLVVPVLYFIFWLWVLIDCLKNEYISGNEKIAWTVVVALVHPVGPILYFFVVKPKNNVVPSTVTV